MKRLLLYKTPWLAIPALLCAVGCADDRSARETALRPAPVVAPDADNGSATQRPGAHTVNRPVSDSAPSAAPNGQAAQTDAGGERFRPVPLDSEPNEQSTALAQRTEGETAAQRPDASRATLPGENLVRIDAEHPTEVSVGEQYDYTLRVTNTSTDKMLHNVKLKQELSDGLSIESSEPKRDDSDEQRQAQWSFDRLGPGETQEVRVTATSDEEGEDHQCLSVVYTPAICLTTRFVKPELEIVKQAPETGNLCEPIQVGYRIVNSGTGPAEDVQIHDDLPEGLQTTDGKREVRIDVGTLAAGASQDYQVQLAASQRGELGSRAIARSKGDKQTRSNHEATDFRQAEVNVAIQGPDAEYINRPMTYTVRITNTGNAVARDADLAVNTPAGTEILRAGDVELSAASDDRKRDAKDDDDKNADAKESASRAAPSPTLAIAPAPLLTTFLQAGAAQGERANAQANRSATVEDDTVNWQFGDLAPGQEALVTLTLIGRERKTVELEAVAAFRCPASEEEKVTATTMVDSEIIALPALLLAAVDDEDPIRLDKEVVYRIVVINQGDAADENVLVVAKLPEQLEYVSSDGPTEGEHEDREIRFGKVDKLEPGQRATWVVRAEAKQEGDVRFQVELSSDSLKTAATSEEPTRLFKASPE